MDMGNMNRDLQKEIEERIRIESIKKETRSCKEKLYEICVDQKKQK